MFVWAGNSGKLLVNEKGRVKDHHHVEITPKYDTDGYKYVEHGHSRYYVHELVIQNHGKPPHKNRLPKKDEVVVFVDENKENCHIDNLEYREKSNDGTFRRPEGVPEAVEEYVWQLLKQGRTYDQIQNMVADSNYENRTISISKIAQIRRERSEKVEEGGEKLTPAEHQSLNAIKKHLGETDDAEAKKQQLAKQANEERAAEIKAEKQEQEEQAEIEKQEKAEQETHFDYEHAGGGWYKIEQDGEEITDQRFLKKDAQKIVKAFRSGSEEGQKILAEYKKEG